SRRRSRRKGRSIRASARAAARPPSPSAVFGAFRREVGDPTGPRPAGPAVPPRRDGKPPGLPGVSLRPSRDLLLAFVLAAASAARTPAQVTQRVSVASGGTPADRDSYDAAVSADGRFVAFE